MKQGIAFIFPLEQIQNKETVMCKFKFVIGHKKGTELCAEANTDIFKYYYYGYTLETVIFDDNDNIMNIHDIDNVDCKEYNISLSTAVTYNATTQSFLATNGFVYDLKESLFARYCGTEYVKRIAYEISTAYNFSLRMYLLNGALLSVNLSKNITPDKASYKYVLEPGFVPGNKDVLKSIIPKSHEEFDKNEKLKQADIDKMIKQMSCE